MTISRRTLLAAGAAALGGGRVTGAARTLSHGRAPNVLVIVLDTLRADRMHPGASRTPRLDAFARRAVTFDDAWAHSSWSLPSHATILTGRLPHEHGADWPGLRLRHATPTLAEFFAARGYVAGAFSSNSSWVTPEYLNHGFLRFQAYSLEDHLRRTTWGRVGDRAAQELGAHNAGRGRKAPAVHAQLLRFIERYADRPFFAYVCHMDANQALHRAKLNHPFWARQPSAAQIVAGYDAGVRVLDAQVAGLLDELERRGTLANTLVVVTSDHGESFGRANPGDHDPDGHGSSLYPEQTAVPLIVRPPGGTTPRRVSTLAGVGALPATIARLLGHGDHPFPGPALPVEEAWAAEVSGAPVVVQTLNYAEHRGQALVTPRHLLLRDLAAGRELLFDRVADPSCAADLGTSHGAFAALRERLRRELAATGLRDGG